MNHINTLSISMINPSKLGGGLNFEPLLKETGFIPLNRLHIKRDKHFTEQAKKGEAVSVTDELPRTKNAFLPIE